MSDVFFAEVALLMLICRNGARELPGITDVRQVFRCDFDRARFEALGKALLGARAVVPTVRL